MRSAAQTFTGTCLGAGKPRRAGWSGWWAAAYDAAAMAVLAYIMAIWASPVLRFFASDHEVIAIGRELRATTLAPNRKFCTPRFVQAVHDARFRVFAWTADSPRQQRALITAGVDGIISNFPERLKTLL